MHIDAVKNLLEAAQSGAENLIRNYNGLNISNALFLEKRTSPLTIAENGLKEFFDGNFIIER